MRLLSGFLVMCLSSYYTAGKSATPIVLWHGMGDSCCNPLSMGSVIRKFEEEIPGVYVHSLQIGSNIVQDTENGFFMNINRQIDLACQKIQNDTRLADGYHAVGFSQGGLFLRGLAQRCPQPRMINLVSFGGPQQGVYGLPHCNGDSHWLCNYVRRLLSYGAYVGWIQRMLVQAQYWHDPRKEEEFKEYSLFLADINNYGDEKNMTYAQNLAKLEKMLLVEFSRDTMVYPKESEWFGWYDENNQLVAMNETRLYQEDWIGLKQLDQDDKLHLMTIDGDHLQIDPESFEEIIKNFLK